jgi:hypothetical protein
MKSEALAISLSILVVGITPATRALANGGQSASSQTAARVPAPKPPAAGDDGFKDLRADADRLKASYEQLDAKNLAEVDSLLRTRQCRIDRIGALLDATEGAMGFWIDAEMKYWQAWSQVEQKRIDEMAKTLAGLEEERKRAPASPTKDASGLTARIEDLKASISRRTVDMRQNTIRLLAFKLDMTGYYEKNRDAADEICNTWTPTAGESGSPAAQTDGSDSFGGLRTDADRLKATYEQLDAKNLAEVDSLLRTSECQINRIGALLDATESAMGLWIDAETKYWQAWSEVEQKRIDGQNRILANMETERKQAAELMESEKQNLEELQRTKAALEDGKPTQANGAEIDALAKDIRDTQARLQGSPDLTSKANNLKAAISARIADMRQNTARLEAFKGDMTGYYEKNRTAAAANCATRQPVPGR